MNVLAPKGNRDVVKCVIMDADGVGFECPALEPVLYGCGAFLIRRRF